MVTVKHLSIYSSLSLAVLLILGCMRESQAGVVEDFNHVERCKDSLYMGTPPRGYLLSNFLKKLCQRYEDKPRFVTLYDPHKHIPVYSAYTFKKSDGEKRVDFPWMFEPQLASEKGSSNMEPFPQSSSHMHMNFEDSQAVLEDYADVVQYERGHLNPDEHQADPLDKASTYTLTNVVPQIREFNIGALGRARGPHPQAPQQLLPRQSLRCHRGHNLWEHDPPRQPGPRGHS
uniref:Endonuclease domain-containing 1 protein n=1 Tax=Salmo salar TaxID=8030 RepID=B5XGH7_SALSA|nr:Endonuclease domain-containing 1 protein precursor [Salmo salar]